jgi:hypothetical protein
MIHSTHHFHDVKIFIYLSQHNYLSASQFNRNFLHKYSTSKLHRTKLVLKYRGFTSKCAVLLTVASRFDHCVERI